MSEQVRLRALLRELRAMASMYGNHEPTAHELKDRIWLDKCMVLVEEVERLKSWIDRYLGQPDGAGVYDEFNAMREEVGRLESELRRLLGKKLITELADGEPPKRPLQGGWLEKDTTTGEVSEPVSRRRERYE